MVVSLDDLDAVFHRASGITHLVTSPAPELLEAMAGRWTTLEDIEASFDLIDGGREALRARLDELEQAGLLERP